MTKIIMKIEIDLKSNELAEKLFIVLNPEISSTSEKFSRSTIMIENKNESFIANLEAIDVAAAKASFNSLMNWISSSLDIFEKYG